MRRHDLATFQPNAQVQVHCVEKAQETQAIVHEWINAGLPLVLTRQSKGVETIATGLTLPPSRGSRRIGCHLHVADILQIRPPALLVDCTANIPELLAQRLRALSDSLKAMDVDARVYGSLSWQAVSGLSYVHSGSDIDLVCEASAPDQLPKLIQLLKTEAQKLDRRLDGEIRFPDGSAVAWLELANVSGDPAAELLIKSNADTRMARVSEIESFFREKPDAC